MLKNSCFVEIFNNLKISPYKSIGLKTQPMNMAYISGVKQVNASEADSSGCFN